LGALSRDAAFRQNFFWQLVVLYYQHVYCSVGYYNEHEYVSMQFALTDIKETNCLSDLPFLLIIIGCCRIILLTEGRCSAETRTAIREP